MNYDMKKGTKVQCTSANSKDSDKIVHCAVLSEYLVFAMTIYYYMYQEIYRWKIKVPS